jgi:hypothetical protein
MAKYQTDLKEWEAKMMAQGKLSLVRAALRDSIKKTLSKKSAIKKRLASMRLRKAKADRLKKEKLLNTLTQTAKRVTAASKKLEQKVKLELKNRPAKSAHSAEKKKKAEQTETKVAKATQQVKSP